MIDPIGTILVTNNHDKLRCSQYKDVEIWDDMEIEGKLDLNKILTKLSLQQVNYVLIESSMNLAHQFLKENLVDEIVVYLPRNKFGTKVVGIFNLPELCNFKGKFGLLLHKTEKLLDNIKVTLRRSKQNELIDNL